MPLQCRIKTVEAKQCHDAVGYYNRLDVFDLKVNRKQLTPTTEEQLAGYWWQ